MASYALGQPVFVHAQFKNENEALTDPTDVTCTITYPNGTQASFVYGTDSEVTKTSTGIYKCTIATTASGSHHYRWTGEGALVGAEESFFKVRDSAFD